MKIYLVRHAQTNYNVLRLCNDDPSIDVHLTELGEQQARALAEKLKDNFIQHMFTSELKRTRQTADIINQYHQVPVSTDSRLNDNKSGFESKPNVEYLAALNKAQDKWTVRLNNGESLEDAKYRVRSFIDSLKQTGYESCLIVSSRVLIQDFYGIVKSLTNEEAWEFPVDLASCTVFEL